MTPQLTRLGSRALLFAGLACRAPEGPPAVADAPSITFPGEVVRFGGTGEQHHATFARFASGVLLTHSTDRRVEVTWLRPSLTPAFRAVLAGWQHHPQVAPIPATEEGVVFVTTSPDGGPVFAQRAGGQGLVGQPVRLSGDPQALYVDADAFGDGLVAVWSRGDDLQGVRLDPDLTVIAHLPDLPGADRIDPPTVRGGADRAWAGWSPRRQGDRVVEVRSIAPDGRWSTAVEVDRAPTGLGSPRTGLAVHPDGSVTVVWRWVDGSEPDDNIPHGAFLRRLDPTGTPISDVWALDGGEAADRPVVEPVGACALVAWEVAGRLWVQLFGADGQPLTEPQEVPADPVSERAYLDVSPHGAGLLSWESPAADGPRDVGLRALQATCPEG